MNSWSSRRRQRRIVLCLAGFFGIVFTTFSLWGILLLHWNAIPSDTVNLTKVWVMSILAVINSTVWFRLYRSRKGRR